MRIAVVLGDDRLGGALRGISGLTQCFRLAPELFHGSCRGGNEFHGAFLHVAADVPGAHCRAPRNMGSSDVGSHVVPANRVGHGEQLASTNALAKCIALHEYWALATRRARRGKA